MHQYSNRDSSLVNSKYIFSFLFLLSFQKFFNLIAFRLQFHIICYVYLYKT